MTATITPTEVRYPNGTTVSVEDSMYRYTNRHGGTSYGWQPARVTNTFVKGDEVYIGSGVVRYTVELSSGRVVSLSAKRPNGKTIWRDMVNHNIGRLVRA